MLCAIPGCTRPGGRPSRGSICPAHWDHLPRRMREGVRFAPTLVEFGRALIVIRDYLASRKAASRLRALKGVA